MKRLILLLALLVTACAPSVNPDTSPPEGYNLNITRGDTTTLVRLEVGEPTKRSQLVIRGSNLQTGSTECVPSATGLWCDLDAINKAVTIQLLGTVTSAAAFVCNQTCYAIRAR